MKKITTIAISEEAKMRLMKEIVHPYEEKTGKNCSYGRAIIMLLDYKIMRKK